MHVRIFNHYIKSPFVLLSIFEFVLLLGCSLVSLQLLSGGLDFSFARIEAGQLKYSIVFALIMMLMTFAMGSYGAGVAEGFGGMLVRSVVSFCLLGAATMVVLYYVVPGLYLGQGSLFISVTLSLVTVLLLRWLFFSIVDVNRLKRRVLVLGAGRRAGQILEKMHTEQMMGCSIVGCLPLGDEEPQVPASMLLKKEPDLMKLSRELGIDEIVVAVDERRKDRGSAYPIDQLLSCKFSGIRILEILDFYEREEQKIDYRLVSAGWMVFGDQFRFSQLRDGTKRTLDIVGAVLLLAAVWPLMLLTAVAVFLESGRPIIYRQERVGYKGSLFNILKFRSMVQDAEKDGKAVWARKNDSRITRVGSFIRNTRLDELPQIVNVFKGEMSFIGPRPERPQFVQELSEQLPYYEVRHQVRPGLTGWAQLKYSYGASVEDAGNKLMYDLYYVKNHSVLLDTLILIQSVEVILLGKGVR